MNTDTILPALRWGMETLPFPALLLYLIVLGLAWLFVESLLTRTARATPGWRKPFPVLPLLSEAAAWLTRGSSWLLWAWAILYVMLVGVHWLTLQGDASGLAWANDTLLGVARTWHQGYDTLMDILPPVVAQALPGV